MFFNFEPIFKFWSHDYFRETKICFFGCHFEMKHFWLFFLLMYGCCRRIHIWCKFHTKNGQVQADPPCVQMGVKSSFCLQHLSVNVACMLFFLLQGCPLCVLMGWQGTWKSAWSTAVWHCRICYTCQSCEYIWCLSMPLSLGPGEKQNKTKNKILNLLIKFSPLYQLYIVSSIIDC